MKTWFGLTENDFIYIIENHFQWRKLYGGNNKVVTVDRIVDKSYDDKYLAELGTMYLSVRFKEGRRTHTLRINNLGDMCVWAGEEDAPGPNNIIDLAKFLMEKGFPMSATREEKLDKLLDDN